MASVEVPIADEEIDTSNPTMAIMTVLGLIAGFAVFSMTSSIGDYVARVINSQLGNVLGTNPATGESDEGLGVL